MFELSVDNDIVFVIWALVVFLTTSYIAISVATQMTSDSQCADKQSKSLRKFAKILWRLFVGNHQSNAKSLYTDRRKAAAGEKSTRYLFWALVVWIAFGAVIFLRW